MCLLNKLEHTNFGSVITQAPAADAHRRTGRPPKKPGEVPTRERLIAAAIDVFAEGGFRGASITDIAARAGISGPGVYKHFATKADLLIQAARHSLDSVSGAAARTPAESVRRWLAPDFAKTRRLLLELHLAAGHEEELLELLAEWHVEQASAWQDRRPDDLAQIKAFYLLLLGLSQLDILSALDVDTAVVTAHVDRMVTALFPEPLEPRT